MHSLPTGGETIRGLNDLRTQIALELDGYTKHTLQYLVHVRAPVTLSHSVQSPTGPLAPHFYSYSFITPQQTLITWDQE